MTSCKPVSTPVDVKCRMDADGTTIDDATHYRQLASALQYLTIMHPDIAFAVHQICLHMHDPRVSHLVSLKRIMRYVRGTPSLGPHLRASCKPEHHCI